ncbi:hypothetical protein Hanom_Chr12g01138681 [Helianthus anomalus]
MVGGGGPLDRKRINDALDKQLEKTSSSPVFLYLGSFSELSLLPVSLDFVLFCCLSILFICLCVVSSSHHVIVFINFCMLYMILLAMMQRKVDWCCFALDFE